ncbi:hypothetical protein CONLIGDRAFT_700516 [Coniochaeta ligniaria NRRL 30616]|uniref:Uncharacterized protein n=1 Tax=Coniochaeta ligniaria NRRL 30616 TaxID=1408157 RepID=A0A1J7JM07_9PEZI|nr:hypothetical protein CONLIGDRAFT_700516 [Coniochaeta ligniaria NRRL 30616]
MPEQREKKKLTDKKSLTQALHVRFPKRTTPPRRNQRHPRSHPRWQSQTRSRCRRSPNQQSPDGTATSTHDASVHPPYTPPTVSEGDQHPSPDSGTRKRKATQSSGYYFGPRIQTLGTMPICRERAAMLDNSSAASDSSRATVSQPTPPR